MAYTEVNVHRDPAGAQEMVRVSGQRGVPVIVVGDAVVVGFDQKRLESLLAAAPRRGLGLAVADADRRVPGKLGAYVGSVKPGSPAAAAGLRPGDLVTGFGGQRVLSAGDLESSVARAPMGVPLEIQWQRGEQVLRGEVEL